MLARIAPYGSTNPWLDSLQRYAPTILCALIGFLSAFTISFGGLMPTGELLLLAVFPWVLIQAYVRRGGPSRPLQLAWFQLLLILAGFTAIGYLASDLYRATPFENLVRGWARVIFLIIDLVAIAYLVDSSWQRLRIMVVALYAGRLLDAVISGPLYGEWWQFGIGYPITIFALLAMAGRSLIAQAIVAASLGIISLVFEARSLGATCLLIAWVLTLHFAHGIWRPVTTLAALLSMVVVFMIALSDREEHSGSNIERRSMLEAAAELFITSPLIGQGSWFTATPAISRIEAKRMALDSTFVRYSEEEARKISIHSQLLTALAEGGLLGGAFFFGLGALLFKTAKTLVRHAMPTRAFLLYLVLAGGWNLLMTPFSGVVRVEIALLTCACFLVVLQRQGELPDVYRE